MVRTEAEVGHGAEEARVAGPHRSGRRLVTAAATLGVVATAEQRVGRRQRARRRAAAALVLLHQHGYIPVPRARVQLVPPPPARRPGRRRPRAPPIAPGVFSYPRQLGSRRQGIAGGRRCGIRQGLGPGPLVARAGLEEARAVSQDLAVQQVTVLVAAGDLDEDLDVARGAVYGELVLGHVR